MTYAEMLALARAGFTKDDIIAMGGVMAQPTPQPVQQVMAQPTPQPAQQVMAQPTPLPVQQVMAQPEGYSPVLPQTDYLGEAIRRAQAAQMNATLPAATVGNTMEAVAADIIGANAKTSK